MLKIITTHDISNIHKNGTRKNELHFKFKKKRHRNVIFLNNLPTKNDNFNTNELIYNFNDLNKCCRNQIQISAKINNYVYG
jgi:hypothetical protein